MPAPKLYNWEFFLAHAGADSASAERFYDLLSPHARVFLDSKSLSLGDEWDRIVPDAQKASLITVVLVSPRTDKEWYRREEIAAAIDLAQREGQRVVPVYLGAAPAEDDVPYGLRRLHSARVQREEDFRQVATQLLALVRKEAPLTGHSSRIAPPLRTPPISGTAPSPIPGMAATPSTAPAQAAGVQVPPTALTGSAPVEEGVPVFLLAARADKAHTDELRKHLYLAKKLKLLHFFSPADDAPIGEERAAVIARHFDEAQVILIFVSAHLFAEWDELVDRALARFHERTARVVPILLTKYDLQGSRLAELVALPREGGPIAGWRDRDAAWAHVATEIRSLVQSLKQPAR